MPVLVVSRRSPEGVEAKVTKSGNARRVPVADRILPLVEGYAAGKGRTTSADDAPVIGCMPRR